jgi:DHA2 family multidrug resistance protein-like MFS transporter
LGGALGIATIGSVVSGLYRSSVGDGLDGIAVPPEVAEAAGDSIGVASFIARDLPAEVGTALTTATNDAFVDAMSAGFLLSAVVLVSAVVIAFTLIPRRMRAKQAELEEETPRPQDGRFGDPVPSPAPA